MGMKFFAECFSEICVHSLVAPGRPLRWIIIANPAAGGFVLPSRWKKCRRALEEGLKAARGNPRRQACFPAETAARFGSNPAFAVHGLLPTASPGDASLFTEALVQEAARSTGTGGADSQGSEPFYLIITAGGDGTSLEVQSVLYHAPEAVRHNMAILRLPMGTGNDGADSPEPAGALELLIYSSRIELSPALRLITAPGGRAESRGPYLAFNILSVGLDAFVTHMTNKMKGKLPGDFYKLWVDIASLLYDKLYTVGFLAVRAVDGQGTEVCSFREKILLLAVGAGGHRTYGSRKKILPDDRNVCALRQMPLLRKLALKEMFNTGTHIDKPEAIPFNARRVEITGEHPILAQMDGETILLQQKDFPAVIELTAPVIPILKLAIP